MGGSGSWSPLSGALCVPPLTSPPLCQRCHLPSTLASVWPGAGPFSPAPCRGHMSPRHLRGSAEDSRAPSTRVGEHNGETGSLSVYEPNRDLLEVSRCLIFPGGQNSMKKNGWFRGGIWIAQPQSPCNIDVPSKSGVPGTFIVKERKGTALHRADFSALIQMKSRWLAQMHLSEVQQNGPLGTQSRIEVIPM